MEVVLVVSQTMLVQTFKYGDIPHYTFPAKLVSRSTELVIAAGEFGRELVHHTRGFTIPVQNRSVEFYWPGRPYNVAADITEDGSVKRYYCNVTLPPRIREDRIDVVDLDLDLDVGRDLQYTVLDRDEFEQHALKYGYPPSVVAGAEAALRELIALVEARAFPFDSSAEQLARRLMDGGSVLGLNWTN